VKYNGNAYKDKMKIVRIISGGQTGSDRNAIDAAIATGIPYSGWCPKGRRSEDGTIPEKYILKETVSSGYTQRTELNVSASSATIIFIMGGMGPGSFQTYRFAQSIGRPCYCVDVQGRTDDEVAKLLLEWLATHYEPTDPMVINVAGSRESSQPGIGDRVRGIMNLVLEACK